MRTCVQRYRPHPLPDPRLLRLPVSGISYRIIIRVRSRYILKLCRIEFAATRKLRDIKCATIKLNTVIEFVTAVEFTAAIKFAAIEFVAVIKLRTIELTTTIEFAAAIQFRAVEFNTAVKFGSVQFDTTQF